MITHRAKTTCTSTFAASSRVFNGVSVLGNSGTSFTFLLLVVVIVACLCQSAAAVFATTSHHQDQSRVALKSASRPHVLFIVADDLGRNDLSYFNGGKSASPAIDDLISGGIWLDSYYTFKVCAPSRTSIMSGRYAWRTGYYDMVDDGGHCLNTGYSTVATLLKKEGYSTHAIGKVSVC